MYSTSHFHLLFSFVHSIFAKVDRKKSLANYMRKLIGFVLRFWILYKKRVVKNRPSQRHRPVYVPPFLPFQLPGSWKICISFRSWKLKMVKTESSRNTYRGVDFNTTRFVPGGFSCTNSPSSCTWRKVLNGYTRNILVNPKIIFEFITLEHELLTEKHKAKTRAIGAAVKGAFRAFDPKPGGSKMINGSISQNFNPGIRNCDFWFPGNNLWKRPKAKT